MRRRSGLPWRAGTALLLAASAASLGGRIFPFLDPVAALQVPLASGWALLLLVLLFWPRARAAWWHPGRVRALAAAGLLLHGLQVGWLWVPPAENALVDPVEARVIWCNVLRRTQNREPLLRMLERADADLVGLAEVPPELARSVATRLPRYRGSHYDGRSALLLLAREPLQDVRVLEFPGGNRALTATAHLAGRRLPVALFHTRVPGSRTQLDNLELLGEYAASHPRLLVLGDLDATPWSAAVLALRRTGALLDLRRGHGVLPTWRPPGLPFALLPLDHALARGPLAATELRVLGDVGSDHLPLALRLQIGSDTIP